MIRVSSNLENLESLEMSGNWKIALKSQGIFLVYKLQTKHLTFFIAFRLQRILESCALTPVRHKTLV